MSLIRWKPQNKQPDVFEDFFNLDLPAHPMAMFNRFQESLPSNWYPAIDVTEEKDHYVIKADLPGLKREDIQISVDQDVLTIRGERKSETEDKNKNYHRVERSYGVFERSLNLGGYVESDQIKAKYKDGVLEVTAPKAERAKAKNIHIEG